MKRVLLIVLCCFLILILSSCAAHGYNAGYSDGYSDGYKAGRQELSPDMPISSVDYVLNMNSKKFHYPDCQSVSQMSEKNKYYFIGSREEVIQKGYTPCGRCKP